MPIQDAPFAEPPLHDWVAQDSWGRDLLPRQYHALPKCSLVRDAAGNVGVSIWIPGKEFGEFGIAWDESGYATPSRVVPEAYQTLHQNAPINQYPGGIKFVRYTPKGGMPIDLIKTLAPPPGEDVFYRVDGVM